MYREPGKVDRREFCVCGIEITDVEPKRCTRGALGGCPSPPHWHSVCPSCRRDHVVKTEGPMSTLKCTVCGNTVTYLVDPNFRGAEPEFRSAADARDAGWCWDYHDHRSPRPAMCRECATRELRPVKCRCGAVATTQTDAKVTGWHCEEGEWTCTAPACVAAKRAARGPTPWFELRQEFFNIVDNLVEDHGGFPALGVIPASRWKEFLEEARKIDLAALSGDDDRLIHVRFSGALVPVVRLPHAWGNLVPADAYTAANVPSWAKELLETARKAKDDTETRKVICADCKAEWTGGWRHAIAAGWNAIRVKEMERWLCAVCSANGAVNERCIACYKASVVAGSLYCAACNERLTIRGTTPPPLTHGPVLVGGTSTEEGKPGALIVQWPNCGEQWRIDDSDEEDLRICVRHNERLYTEPRAWNEMVVSLALRHPPREVRDGFGYCRGPAFEAYRALLLRRKEMCDQANARIDKGSLAP